MAKKSKGDEFKKLVKDACRCALRLSCGTKFTAVNQVLNCTSLGKWNETAGSLDSAVMFVSETPSSIDEITRKYGKLWERHDPSWLNLKNSITSWGLDMAELYFTNAFLCKPAVQRVRRGSSSGSYPDVASLRRCAETFLRAQIAIIKPK